MSERAEPITDGDSEGQFRTHAADISGAVFRRAAESPWRFERVSDAIEATTGHRPAEFTTPGHLADVPLAVPEDRPAVGAAIARAASTGQPYEIEYRVRHADGTIHWVRDLGFPVPDGNGRPTRLDGVIFDITELKRAEQALRDSHRRLEHIIDGAHLGTWEWNVQTGETVYNDVWAQIVGYELAELLPTSIRTWQTRVHPEDLKQADDLLERHFRGELPLYDCEVRLKHRDGHWVWVHDRGRVITRADDGTPLTMFGTRPTSLSGNGWRAC